MHTLILKPLATNYQVTPASGIVSQTLADRSTRSRRDVLGGATFASLTWKCNPEQYKYFWIFYHELIFEGAAPFKGYVHAIKDSTYCKLQQLKIDPLSLSFNPLPRGGHVIISAQVEIVTPPIEEIEIIEAMLIGATGSFEDVDHEVFLNLFEVLVNEALPNNLGDI